MVVERCEPDRAQRPEQERGLNGGRRGVERGWRPRAGIHPGRGTLTLLRKQ